MNTEAQNRDDAAREWLEKNGLDTSKAVYLANFLWHRERAIREAHARIAECEYRRGDTPRDCADFDGYGGFTLAAERIARAIRADDRATHGSAALDATKETTA